MAAPKASKKPTSMTAKQADKRMFASSDAQTKMGGTKTAPGARKPGGVPIADTKSTRGRKNVDGGGYGTARTGAWASEREMTNAKRESARSESRAAASRRGPKQK